MDDSSSEQSHRKAAATKMIIRMGSWAIDNVNIANGGPNARQAQPKNSAAVIALLYVTMCLRPESHHYPPDIVRVYATLCAPFR